MTNLPNPFPGFYQPITSTTTSVPNIDVIKKSNKLKKAGKNGNLIAIVLDESGSMASCLDQTISGYNEFLQGQRLATTAETGDAFLSLVKFEGSQVKNVYHAKPLNEIPNLHKGTYIPGSTTNLLDAIGQTIFNVNEFLKLKKKKDRPGVIITIITDGEENSSRKYNNSQIKELVSEAESADWSFVFLGANIDSFAVGSNFGMREQNTASFNVTDMASTMAVISDSTVRMRSAKMAGVDTETLYSSGIYTVAERNSMKKDQ